MVSPIQKGLTDLYFAQNAQNVFGMPTKWSLDINMEAGLLNAYGQLDVPIRQVSYLKAKEFFNWSLEVASLYAGAGGRPNVIELSI